MRSGRPPKAPDQKRHRGKPTAEWVILPIEGRKGRIPPLPKHLPFTQHTREWWKRMWRSPMATMWAAEDVEALMDLALLRQELHAGKASLGSEVRQRMDEFGLSPAGRKALRWVVPGDEHEKLVPKKQPTRKQHLQVVDSA